MGLHRNRILEALVFFARSVNHPTKMMMYKLLAELDFRHFREAKMPVTGLMYEVWKRGPVPSELHSEITDKKNNEVQLPNDFSSSLFVEKEKWTDPKTGKENTKFNFRAKRKPDLSIFTPRQQRILKEIVEIYKDTDATTSSDASHERGTAWHNAFKRNGLNSEIDFIKDSGVNSNEIEEGELSEFFAIVANYGK